MEDEFLGETHPAWVRPRCASGGITLDPQGKVRADFPRLGKREYGLTMNTS